MQGERGHAVAGWKRSQQGERAIATLSFSQDEPEACFLVFDSPTRLNRTPTVYKNRQNSSSTLKVYISGVYRSGMSYAITIPAGFLDALARIPIPSHLSRGLGIPPRFQARNQHQTATIATTSHLLELNAQTRFPYQLRLDNLDLQQASGASTRQEQRKYITRR